jgi:hypothetical protein
MRVSTNWLSEVTGKHAATIKKRISQLPRDSEGKVDSSPALEAIYVGGGGTTEEVIRQLNIARKNEIDLDMEIKRKERIPIEVVQSVNDSVDQEVAAIIKSSGLPPDSCNRIFDQLRDIPNRLKW